MEYDELEDGVQEGAIPELEIKEHACGLMDPCGCLAGRHQAKIKWGKEEWMSEKMTGGGPVECSFKNKGAAKTHPFL